MMSDVPTTEIATVKTFVTGRSGDVVAVADTQPGVDREEAA